MMKVQIAFAILFITLVNGFNFFGTGAGHGQKVIPLSVCLQNLLTKFPQFSKSIKNVLTPSLYSPRDRESDIPLVFVVLAPEDETTTEFLNMLSETVACSIYSQDKVYPAVHKWNRESPQLNVFGEMQEDIDSKVKDKPVIFVVDHPLNDFSYEVVGIPLHGFFDNTGWPYSSSATILHIRTPKNPTTEIIKEKLWNDPKFAEVVPAFHSRLSFILI